METQAKAGQNSSKKQEAKQISQAIVEDLITTVGSIIFMLATVITIAIIAIVSALVYIIVWPLALLWFTLHSKG